MEALRLEDAVVLELKQYTNVLRRPAACNGECMFATQWALSSYQFLSVQLLFWEKPIWQGASCLLTRLNWKMLPDAFFPRPC